MKFNSCKWFARIHSELGSYETLWRFIESEELIANHVDSHDLTRFYDESDGGLIAHQVKPSAIEDARDDLYRAIASSLESARNTYSRQMIVLLVTLNEGIIQEFFECFFLKHPEKMHDYINAGDKKGWIKFTDFLKEDLLSSLASNCSSTALQGDYKKALKRLEQLSNSSMNDKLRNYLISLAVLRNEIVHDDAQKTITVDQVREAFDKNVTFLKWLSRTALENQVPVIGRSGKYIVGEEEVS